MTRILHAIAGAQHGGAERFFERLVPALSRAGCDQRALIRNHPDRLALMTREGVSTFGLGFGGRLDVLTPWQFRRHVRDFRPQIVFTWMSRASKMAPSPADCGVPFLRVARLGGYYDLKYYQGFDYLIGDTESIVHYLIEQGWPEDRCVYLPNFVSAQRGTPIPRRVFSIPEGAPILLGLGRLHTNKAFDVLIRAVAKLHDVYLLLAGEGPERAALEDLATSLGVKPRVRFLGWRDDVPDLFATADLFVHPARHEPLGNVILEAWAQGKTVISTAADGPALLIEQGVSGLLVPIDQPEPLSQAIRAALSDASGAQALAEAGYARYLEGYTESAVVGRYQDYFRKIIKD